MRAIVNAVGPCLKIRAGIVEQAAVELLPGQTWGRLTYEEIASHAGRAVDLDPERGTITAVGGNKR